MTDAMAWRDIEPAAARVSSGPSRGALAVIGIDDYHHCPRLDNAVRDARRTAELLEQLGFAQLAALYGDDATGEAIGELVKHDLRELGPDDSLIVYFAGHGSTCEHRPGGAPIRTGYLIPVDGAASPDDRTGWLAMEGLLRDLALLDARHVLVILDACHAGIALDGLIERHGSAGPDGALDGRRSRLVITSAQGGERALDRGPDPQHSVFAGYLIEKLVAELATPADPRTTGSELGLHVQRRIRGYPGAHQTPVMGRFDFDDHGELMIPFQAAIATSRAAPVIVTPRAGTSGALHDRVLASLAAAGDGLTLATLATQLALASTDLAVADAALLARDWIRGTPGGRRAITTAGRERLARATKGER